ncbi:tRNA nucleotidyltransferase [Halalkalibacter wakoensis JCM 9140]|uniref:tRNA nucleotidyltransferase n=1 Tax=Halalkalibacter wakoensis JCM 9140 TaxID=1236970 RepID=W4PZV6_9BACI|nr:CBS domain-containing protein [Halalkalibacter wakoensis]GAE25272.1 tRNA nucleotidyltransferase [Halalkalibacter wakoensis JCM 9140]
MNVIVSHVNIDFDGLASLLAAKKLHPDAQVALSDKQNPTVKSYLAIYRDELKFSSYKDIQWSEVTTLILVDVASMKRTGIPVQEIRPDIRTIVYDHHSPKEEDISSGERYIEQVGATITMLMERLHARNIQLTPFEATLFGLGLYTDTGNFTYQQTTERDLYVGFLLKQQKMDIQLVDRFSGQTLSMEERDLFQSLLTNGTQQYIDGITLFITTYEQPFYQSGLATLTRRLMESTDSDAAISIVKMKEHVYVVARSSTDRVDLRKLMDRLGGGGHAQAASATVKKEQLQPVIQHVTESLSLMIQPAITAADIMACPVKYVAPDLSIDEVLDQMYQYGHTGFPVVNKEGVLVGIISRRDVDKATHHGLGHAPVKAYMSTQLVTLGSNASLEEIQATMMKHNIGRIPILSDNEMIGILSRTDIIEQLHRETNQDNEQPIVLLMKQQLSKKMYELLLEIGSIADQQSVKIYLIGGIVRDFILQRPNEDIDLVVEGDGIAFANQLKKQLGGNVKSHEKFGTATWTTEENHKLDIVTCRTEYYDAPAALPNVRASNIREDLRRRDFTINAMALQINKRQFGKLLDFFQGQEDIQLRKIRILHTLSFIEDPTRIIRAVRFALRFQYELAEHTFELALNAVPMLKQVSAKRLLREFELLQKENVTLDAVTCLQSLGIWSTLFHREPNEHTMKKLSTIIKEMPHPFITFLTIAYGQKDWHVVIKPYALISEHNQMIEQLIKMEQIDIKNESLSSIHDQLHLFQDDVLYLFAQLTNDQKLLTYLQKRKQLNLLLSGKDLIDKGLNPGPDFSDLLHQLACLQLDEIIQTKDDAVTWLENKVAELPLD